MSRRMLPLLLMLRLIPMRALVLTLRLVRTRLHRRRGAEEYALPLKVVAVRVKTT